MSKCTENEPLGFVDCLFCGARVELRKSSKTGKAYWTCDGDHDVRACHTQVRLGARPTRDLLEEQARAAASEARTASPRPEPLDELEQTSPATVPSPGPKGPSVASIREDPGATRGSKPPAAKPAGNPFDVWNNLFQR